MGSRQRVRILAITGSVVAVAAAIAAGYALTKDVRPVRPGSKAPDFRAVNVKTGDTVSMRDYAGSILLLNLWATWCAPCEVEMPSMQRLHEQLGPNGLRILAVSVDDESSDFVARWAEERGLTFDILHDRGGQIALDYQSTGWPETFIIDEEGVIVRKIWGPAEWDDEEELERFRRLLGISSPSGGG